VAGADHQTGIEPRISELTLRVCSALVLVPLALVAAYVGGWLFAAFWGVAALGVLWEWMTLVAGPGHRAVLSTAAASIVLALALAALGFPIAGIVVLVVGALASALPAPGERRHWVAWGTPYAGAIALAPVILRAADWEGFLAIVFLFVVVWTTDIVAYFVGRAVGGPRLLPQVSPKKTWSGALGGTLGAVAAATAFAAAAALPGRLAVGILAAGLSVLAQAGDLFESFAKRRFGAKDSSHLIPGHGGLMDRLDGFVLAAVAATLIGLLRGGLDAPGRGLLLW
jgi:phosphatidate cytidylyltransferase